MAELNAQLLFDLEIGFADGAQLLDAGDGGRGKRRVAPAAGGTFHGPHLRGTVLPNVPDYIVARPDGVTEHDIRAVLRTDDGALIYMEYAGIGHRLPLGPLDDGGAGRFYFRVTCRFETGAEQYRWLNRVLAVGINRSIAPGAIGWSVYALR